MPDPNVLSYFLLVLSGFGTVWIFRKLTGRREKKITEFEYAGFSTLWGIFVFEISRWLLIISPENITEIVSQPYFASPGLFFMGVMLGALGALAEWVMRVVLNTFRGM